MAGARLERFTNALEKSSLRMKRPAKPLDGLGGTVEKQVVPVRSGGGVQTGLHLAPAVLARSRRESEIAARTLGGVDAGLRAERLGSCARGTRKVGCAAPGV